MTDNIDLTINLPPELHEALRALASRRDLPEQELAVKAIRLYLMRVSDIPSPIGILRDEAELLDAVTDEAFAARTRDSLRVRDEADVG